MSKVKKAIIKVAKNLNINTADISEFDGRGVLSDGFTSIMAAHKSVGIKDWAVAHKQFVDTNWEAIKNNTVVAKNDYQKIIVDKLKRCLTKPEIDIVYETTFTDDIEVVVFTDTVDAMVTEAEEFRKALK